MSPQAQGNDERAVWRLPDRPAPPPGGLELGPEAARDLLARLADGVMLVDDGGDVVWWNPALEHALGDLRRRRSQGLRVEDVFATPAAGLGAEPATSLSAVRDGRWRLAGPPSADVRVSAFPIRAGGRALTALHVRPEAAEPYERPATAVMCVAALGPLAVEVDGEGRSGDWLQQRPGQLLRFLLGRRRRPTSSEAIAAALWPERGPAGTANVRYSMYRLREQLDERDGQGGREGSLILKRGGGYVLDPARLRIDVDDFEQRATAGLRALERGERERAEAELTAALELYRGEFLADEPYAEWAFAEREYLRGVAHRGLRALGELALAAGRVDEAAGRFGHLAELEPFDTDVHGRLIEICLRRGRRSEAVRQFTALRRRLHRAFGVMPDFTLHELAARAASSAWNGGEAGNGQPTVARSA